MDSHDKISSVFVDVDAGCAPDHVKNLMNPKHNAELEALYRERPFDFVIPVYAPSFVFWDEHCNPNRSLFRMAVAVLKPGGSFMVASPTHLLTIVEHDRLTRRVLKRMVELGGFPKKTAEAYVTIHNDRMVLTRWVGKIGAAENELESAEVVHGLRYTKRMTCVYRTALRETISEVCLANMKRAMQRAYGRSWRSLFEVSTLTCDEYDQVFAVEKKK